MLPIIDAFSLALELSPIGIDWWIILGGWVPGFLGMAAALIIWARSRGEKDE
ncbi:MAG: hypothetical protein QFX35_01680 [Candidatus Verstraetearchaeota archaeon]|nr:hypothetical protein [Candidatus Verstraetearchaeota archaeon]